MALFSAALSTSSSASSSSSPLNCGSVSKFVHKSPFSSLCCSSHRISLIPKTGIATAMRSCRIGERRSGERGIGVWRVRAGGVVVASQQQQQQQQVEEKEEEEEEEFEGGGTEGDSSSVSVQVPVSSSNQITMFFRAEGTMDESRVPAVTKTLEEVEGVGELKVRVLEGIASIELTKQTTFQATGVASDLVAMIQGSGFKLQTLNLSFEEDDDDNVD